MLRTTLIIAIFTIQLVCNFFSPQRKKITRVDQSWRLVVEIITIGYTTCVCRIVTYRKKNNATVSLLTLEVICFFFLVVTYILYKKSIHLRNTTLIYSGKKCGASAWQNSTFSDIKSFYPPIHPNGGKKKSVGVKKKWQPFF